MPIAEAIKNDREAYPLKRDQVIRMLGDWRMAPPEKKAQIAERLIILVKVQFKCQLSDLSDDRDFDKEFTPDVVADITRSIA